MPVFGVILVRIFSTFSRIRTEYREIRSISPYPVWMRENAGKMRTRITLNTDTFYAVYSKNCLAEKRNCSNEGQVIKVKQFKQIDNEHRGETKQEVQLVNKDVTPAGFWCLLKNRMKVFPRHSCNVPQANRAYY